MVTLTKRETDMMYAVANGWSNPRIAKELGVSVQTVKNHLSSIYEKLEVANRTGAMTKAFSLGLIKMENLDTFNMEQ